MLIGPADDAVVFDWEPTLVGGAELLGGRGTDARLDERHRRTNAERRREFHDRKDAQTAAREEPAAERRAGHWTDPAGAEKAADADFAADQRAADERAADDAGSESR